MTPPLLSSNNTYNSNNTACKYTEDFHKSSDSNTTTKFTKASGGNNNDHTNIAAMSSKQDGKTVTTEYVLNFAFYSFVGFILIQAGFAALANSQSMLADCEAMAVDAMTYLFNLCAERIKNKPLTEKELQLSAEQRETRREVRRLWLELVPPTISVTCLIAIVILTTRDAFMELWGVEYMNDGDGDGNSDDDVSVPIMLVFSAANLLLDFINVACFAKSGSSFGLQMMKDEQDEIRASFRGLSTGETAALVSSSLSAGSTPTTVIEKTTTSTPTVDAETGEMTVYGSTGAMPSSSSTSALPLSVRHVHNKTSVNLNMCSAWTVRCYCKLSVHACSSCIREELLFLIGSLTLLLLFMELPLSRHAHTYPTCTACLCGYYA
jgi:hypothetical protein